MIRYRLACGKGHEFDAWFRSSDDFEAQAARRLVSCAVCGDTDVRKAIMAPAVGAGRSRAAPPPDEGPSPPPAPAAEAVAGPEEPPRVPMVAPDPRRQAMIAALRELKRKVVESADYVGEKFPEQARQMHYGEREHRGIWGEASPEEAQALLEEGVAVAPLPVLPDERN